LILWGRFVVAGCFVNLSSRQQPAPRIASHKIKKNVVSSFGFSLISPLFLNMGLFLFFFCLATSLLAS
jgi:hypothetical protein